MFFLSFLGRMAAPRLQWRRWKIRRWGEWHDDGYSKAFYATPHHSTSSVTSAYLPASIAPVFIVVAMILLPRLGHRIGHGRHASASILGGRLLAINRSNAQSNLVGPVRHFLVASWPASHPSPGARSKSVAEYCGLKVTEVAGILWRDAILVDIRRISTMMSIPTDIIITRSNAAQLIMK
jgi:hypothetical protein